MLTTITEIRNTEKYQTIFNSLTIDNYKDFSKSELNESVKFYMLLHFYESEKFSDAYEKTSKDALDGLITTLANYDFKNQSNHLNLKKQ